MIWWALNWVLVSSHFSMVLMAPSLPQPGVVYRSAIFDHGIAKQVPSVIEPPYQLYVWWIHHWHSQNFHMWRLFSENPRELLFAKDCTDISVCLKISQLWHGKWGIFCDNGWGEGVSPVLVTVQWKQISSSNFAKKAPLFWIIRVMSVSLIIFLYKRHWLSCQKVFHTWAFSGRIAFPRRYVF